VSAREAAGPFFLNPFPQFRARSTTSFQTVTARASAFAIVSGMEPVMRASSSAVPVGVNEFDKVGRPANRARDEVRLPETRDGPKTTTFGRLNEAVHNGQSAGKATLQARVRPRAHRARRGDGGG